MCHADPSEYVCVLTSGATAALKLVGEAFPWREGSTYLHLHDNHNSVLGIRELAAVHGAKTGCVDAAGMKLIETEYLAGDEGSNAAAAEVDDQSPEHLFAFPLESNFSGTRYSEALVSALQGRKGTRLKLNLNEGAVTWHKKKETVLGKGSEENPQLHKYSLEPGRWRVLIDAAKACGTQPPDLSKYPADFVAISFYKIFGYPTGLGALLVRRDALAVLRKAYFGGGTVLASTAENRFHAPRPGPLGFEDGTLPFLSIPSVLRGFESWKLRGGFPAAQTVAQAAATRFAGSLLSMRHGNGAPVATVYGQWSALDNSTSGREGSIQYSLSVVSGQGPTVTFNLLDRHGAWVGHRQVQRITSLEGVFLRSGVMCNPGGCGSALGVAAAEAQEWFDAGHVCWDDKDVLNNKPTGAVRASFGWASTIADAEALVDIIKRHFIDDKKENDALPATTVTEGLDYVEAVEKIAVVKELRVHSLVVYPIKSGGGYSPRSWLMGSTGLLYDRHWAVIDAEGKVLTQKRCPALATLKPVLDLEAGVMKVNAPGATAPLVIPLSTKEEGTVVGSLAVNSSTTRETSTNTKPLLGSAPPQQVEVKVCTRAVPACPAQQALVSGSVDASRWLNDVLGMPCRLVEHSSDVPGKKKVGPERGFSNDAQVLMVTLSSIKALQKKCGLVEEPLGSFIARFRPNLVIEDIDKDSDAGSDGEIYEDALEYQSVHENNKQHTCNESSEYATITTSIAFEEETWSSVKIGDLNELMVAGGCPRCEMICLDPGSGMRSGREPLLTLARERKGAGKRRLCFGVLLNRERKEEEGEVTSEEEVGPWGRRIAVGMAVQCIATSR